MKNSGILAVTCTVLSVFVCSLAGYGFACFQFRENRLLFLVVILTILIPPQLTGLPNYVLFSSFDFFGLFRAITGHATNLNLLNNMGVMMLMAALGQGLRAGLFIFIFRQYYKGVPNELEQAAVIDGCGYTATYFRIMLPNAGGPIRICTLFSLVWYWSDYYTLSTYLPDVRIVSSVLGDMRSSLQHILAQDALDPYKIITIEQAACIASVLPLLLLFLIVQKTFARSVETTGLVG